jgi:uncharacterized repeat protein (TIGR01451 family)
MTRKKRILLIVVVCVLAAAIPVTLALMHRGQVPPDGGGGGGGTADIPTDDSTASSPLAILSAAAGNVSVMKAGTSGWTDAQVWMSLVIGDIVRSGNVSSAEITFSDGTTIDLDADTQVEIAALDISTTGTKTIGLKQVIGNTVSRVTHLVDTESSYQIETPAPGVAAVRGSIMVVYVMEDGTTLITNRQGTVFGIAQGVELRIPLGRTCIIEPGQPPRLLPLPSSGWSAGRDHIEPMDIVTDLAIDATASSGAVKPGESLTYTFRITNNGPSDSSGALVLDVLSPGVSFVSATDGGTYDSGTHTVTWVLGGLASGAGTSVNVTVQLKDPAPSGPITNSVAVAANERDTYRPNNTDSQAVTIIVNHPPVAGNDFVSTDEDSPVMVAAPGVLTNDSDPDAGDNLTVTSVDTSGVTGLIAAWNADGSFTYDPNGQFEYLRAGHSATNSFAYTVSDGNGGTDTAVVTITIDGANDAPADISLDNSSVAENRPSGTLVGDFSTTDPDIGDTFAYTLASGTGSDDNSWFTVVGNHLQTAATFNYETKSSYSVRVRSTDSGLLFCEQVFVITVTNGNDPPVALDDNATTDADTAVTVDVLDNDSDPDGDALTVASVTQGAHGSVVNNGDDVTYTPAAGFSGADSFTYTISDGNGGTDTATVTVTVTRTTARINVQIDTGPTAAIYIWDDTTGSWAMDEDTQELVDGTNHVTSDIIAVAAGHYYYVWIEAAGVEFYPKSYPKDWIATSAPVGDSDAVYGCAPKGSLCPIHFTMK